MPRAVAYYRERKHYAKIRPIQKTILDSYLADIAAAGDHKMIECLDSIPKQLERKNKKFQYRAIKQGASAPRYARAIEKLVACGLVLKCVKITDAVFPLADHAEADSFKLYLNDTGLLCAKFGMEAFELLSPRLSGNIKEALAENYCASQLHALGYPLYYWQSGNSAQIQFLIEKDGAVIPVEVKANACVKSRSLSVFIERYKPPYSIQISEGSFSFENDKQNIPFYAVFCL
jgi:predicted AAA+ superfamily ATPase